MDCLQAVQAYIKKALESAPGIKCLLLDAETLSIFSLASTQSQLLSHDTFLTERIDGPSRNIPASFASGSGAYPPTSSRSAERLPHLKCVCILRPTDESIEACEREIREGKYGSYYLYFTNILKKSQIEQLAEADEHELVKEVQEFFLDYSPLTSSHFSLSLLPTPLHPSPTQRAVALYGDSANSWAPASPAFARHVEGLSALLLSLKKKPIIRYERMSAMAKKLGSELLYQMNNQPDLWDFRKAATAPLLLILDRRNDPVTPLLTQWTYQAMVHECIGITNGRVNLGEAQDVRDELKEIVLSPDQDPFFATNLYDNFGDLGAHLQEYVLDYKNRSASSTASKIETVADMKRFIEEYPEFRKLGGNVSKHVALVGELSRLVKSRHLLEVSELEQSLASNESHGSDLRMVQSMISSADIPPESKLRLAILYALRYQKLPGNNIPGVVEALKQQNVPDPEMVHVMLNFAGAEQRQDDLFANENFFSRGKSALKGLKGVENVYTQHTPHLAETIDLLLRGRLKETSYPFIEGQMNAAPTAVGRPQDIIIFIVGGTTYEEAKTIASLNNQFASGHGLSGSVGPGANQIGVGTRLLLGGTCVHNSKSFLTMVRDASFSFPTAASATLAMRPSQPAATGTPAGPRQEGLNLNIGPVSLNVGGNAGGAIEAGVDSVKDVAQGLFSRLRQGVDGVRLP
ncbi:Sec1-like protein [Meredithblackwellia eburnea MCA 4105]